MKVDTGERIVNFDVFKKECVWRYKHSNDWCGIIHKKCNACICLFVKRIIQK
jgi:hypothetical protein